MTDTNVNVIIKARDEAKRALNSTNKSVNRLSESLKTAAKSAAVFFGARALFRFGKESVELFGIQEDAVNNLRASLELLGPVTQETVSDFEAWASEIQQVTTLGDEAVLEIASLGASMAKLSGQALKDATVAAIGLSKCLQIDVNTSMVFSSNAGDSNTSSFSRYGVTLDTTLTKQEQFQQVLQRGIKDFSLAEAETETYRGQMIQLSNTWGDVKEQIGSALAGPLSALLGMLKNITAETISTIGTTLKWVASIGAAVLIAPKIVSAITFIVKAIKAWRIAQVSLLALAGPAGWATLAAGTAIAIGSMVTLNAVFDDTKENAKNLISETQQVADSLDIVADSSFDVADAMKKQAKANDLVESSMKSIRDQINAVGKTPDEILISKLVTEGATQKQIAEVQELMQQLKAVKGAGDIKGTQKLSIKESRFLTLAPGAKVDPVQKNTQQMVTIMNELLKQQKKQNSILEKQDTRQQSIRVTNNVESLGLVNV